MSNSSLASGPQWISDPVGKTSEFKLPSKKAKLLHTRKAYSNKYMEEQKQADIHLHEATYKPKK